MMAVVLVALEDGMVDEVQVFDKEEHRWETEFLEFCRDRKLEPTGGEITALRCVREIETPWGEVIQAEVHGYVREVK